ncbi:MAG: tetratricopeptide repeat protein [Thiotrichaceae bacterium]|nr:tetratricopeptide repeat protein [Thiotrichaceae bacterium]
MTDITKIMLIALCTTLVVGCSSTPRVLTVADVERESQIKEQPFETDKVATEERLDVDIYQAYTAYVEQSEKGDHFRSIAISRLADLELEVEFNDAEVVAAAPLSEELLTAKKEKQNRIKLERTMGLLEMSLRDYPDLGSNDEVLYRLAMILSQLDKHVASVDALEQLVERHKGSRFYLEAQFRLAEDAFVIGDYEGAAQRYSKIIEAPANLVFYEKAYFKRGWSRFKLQEYKLAVDDLMKATAYRDAKGKDGGRGAIERDEHFDAYFYAIALNFSYMEEHRALADYFRHARSSKFTYYIYSELSDIYLAQKRYSDVVAILKLFSEEHPGSRYLPQMEFRIVTTWERSGFFDSFYAAADGFYSRYNPSASYWDPEKKTKKIKAVMLAEIKPLLRDNVFSIASYYHNQYQSTSTDRSFELASKWYERYLTHFSETALDDNVNYAYADLLSEKERYEKAIGHYEIVAYKGGVIVDQRAAYATVVLAERLYSQSVGGQKVAWQLRYIKHALLFKRTYPLDMRSERIILRAAEIAFAGEKYQQAVNIAGLLAAAESRSVRYEVGLIKAESLFNLAKFEKAERVFLTLIHSLAAGDARKKKMEDRLALTIYRQAEVELAAGNDVAARQKFERIAALVGDSEIAPKGLYDATVLAMAGESWVELIDYASRFRSQYPDHERRDDVTKLLSVAYINAGQHANAAQILEEVYEIEQDSEIKMASLWQSAELYEALKDMPASIRTYQRYVEVYQQPFPPYMEALNKLTMMNDAMGDTRRGDLWAGKIRKADHQIDVAMKTDRTNHIAGVATLRLAREKKTAFDKLTIRQPLKVHLKRKKDAMDWARGLYTTAYEYHSPEIMTESLFSIAEMYYGFSLAVMDSTRPKGLNDDEMEQYEIGIEDLAFPVEEKAIEIYESTLSHVNQGIFNIWTQKSYHQLAIIFPARYAKELKVDAYAN